MNHNNKPDMGMPIYMNECDQCTVGGMRIGMTYVPMQPWEAPYTPDEALRAGTIFSCLFLPFIGGGCK